MGIHAYMGSLVQEDAALSSKGKKKKRTYFFLQYSPQKLPSPNPQIRIHHSHLPLWLHSLKQVLE